MNEVISCKEYNRRGYEKYNKEVKEYKPNQGGFPYIGFYIFEKNYGYVLTTKHGGRWFKTKREALKKGEDV